MIVLRFRPPRRPRTNAAATTTNPTARPTATSWVRASCTVCVASPWISSSLFLMSSRVMRCVAAMSGPVLLAGVPRDPPDRETDHADGDDRGDDVGQEAPRPAVRL